MKNIPLIWSSPVPIDVKEGLALAICVRLVATAQEQKDGTVKFRTYNDRTDPIPSTFTADMIEHMVKQYSYLLFRIRTNPYVLNEQDVLELIDKMDESQAQRWYMTHESYIKEIEKDLHRFVAKKGSLGFRCAECMVKS